MLDYPNQRELAILSHTLQLTIARIKRDNNTSVEATSKITFALNQKLTTNIG